MIDHDPTDAGRVSGVPDASEIPDVPDVPDVPGASSRYPSVPAAVGTGPVTRTGPPGEVIVGPRPASSSGRDGPSARGCAGG